MSKIDWSVPPTQREVEDALMLVALERMWMRGDKDDDPKAMAAMITAMKVQSIRDKENK